MAKKKRGRGRPAIVSDDEVMETKRDTLIAYLRKGASLRAAAGASGLGVSSVMNALRLGRQQKRGKYRDFLDQVRTAMDQSRVLIETRLFKHTEKNARAALAMLKARYPDEWDPMWLVRMIEAERGLEDRSTTPLPTVRVRRETAVQREARETEARKAV